VKKVYRGVDRSGRCASDLVANTVDESISYDLYIKLDFGVIPSLFGGVTVKHNFITMRF